jgi:hypothetical protein
MIYLAGITVSNCLSRKSYLFKRLRIPFKNEKELERFRFNMELKKNRGKELIDNKPPIRVSIISTENPNFKYRKGFVE